MLWIVRARENPGLLWPRLHLFRLRGGRVAFINFLIENGDDTPKELQELARHSSIDMSWNVYGRANEERARDAVENLSAIMEIEAESVPFVHRLAVGAERENATHVDTGGCAVTKLAPALGLAPRSHVLHNDAESQQNNAKSRQSSALAKSPDTADEQKPALPQQNPSTSTHQKCVPSVSKNPDLEKVVAAWDDLPDLIKAQILALVKTST